MLQHNRPANQIQQALGAVPLAHPDPVQTGMVGLGRPLGRGFARIWTQSCRSAVAWHRERHEPPAVDFAAFGVYRGIGGLHD
jgi:hypothetical protein